MQMEIEVKGQRIKRINSPGSVEDTLNYLTCHFTFDGSEWENTIKTAYFKNRATEKIYSSLIADDGTCTVPWEALTDKGFVRFSVAGERENYRITTDIESFYNSETVYGGQPSGPPTPDQYDQLIALAQETKEIAESVRSDADAGKFDGEPGKPGDPGKDGVSPSAKVDETNDGAVITVTDATGTTTAKLKNGKDGNPGQDATDEQVRTAVDAYMEEHPMQGETEDIIKLAIKNEASGAVPISITDSADMGVQDLEMQGWTEQAQYEGKNLFDISDFETNNKGIIENGTILFNQSLGTVMYYLNLNPGTYSISTKRSGHSGIYIKVNEVAVINNGGSGNFTGNFDVSDGDSVVLEFSEGQNPNGEDRMIYDIMLNSGSTALPYEPYTGGQPSPSPDYPQPITSAGKYNEGTGKWEYEITIANAQTDPDKNQTVLITSDRPLTKWDRLEKRNGQWGWVYKSNHLNLTGTEDFVLYETTENINKFVLYNIPTEIVLNYNTNSGYSNTFLYDPDVLSGEENGTYRIYTSVSTRWLAISIDKSYTLDIFKDFLQEKYEEGNPLIFWYETAEETFVPLSESEQEQMNALHTYYPTTILDNDQGCDMALTYIADTKAYIDNKVSAIQAAIVNTI